MIKKAFSTQFSSSLLKLLIITALLCSGATVRAATPSEDLTSLLSSFQGMRAEFKQVAIGGKSKSKEITTGDMALQRPGKFRWDVKQPNPQLLIADGHYLWIYDADLQQATRQSLDVNNANSPASLLSGSITSLQNRFIVTGLPQSNMLNGFRLKPKSDNDMFDWIELYFSKDKKLTKMLLKDNLGTLNTFYFNNVQINPSLSKNLFKFKAPKGVEVIKNG